MTLLLVWHETLKSVFVIVFTVFDVIMTWLIDRAWCPFLYSIIIWKTTIGQFQNRRSNDNQKLDSTKQPNEDPRRLLTDLELGTRSALLEVEACSMFRSRFTKKNSGIRAHLIEVIKHEKTKNWACIMWILLTCHFPRDIKGLHTAFTRNRTPLTWLETKMFKT